MIIDERQELRKQYENALEEMSMCDSNNEGHTEALLEVRRLGETIGLAEVQIDSDIEENW